MEWSKIKAIAFNAWLPLTNPPFFGFFPAMSNTRTTAVLMALFVGRLRLWRSIGRSSAVRRPVALMPARPTLHPLEPRKRRKRPLAHGHSRTGPFLARHFRRGVDLRDYGCRSGQSGREGGALRRHRVGGRPGLASVALARPWTRSTGEILLGHARLRRHPARQTASEIDPLQFHAGDRRKTDRGDFSGSEGLFCFDSDGKLFWKRTSAPSSPAITSKCRKQSAMGIFQFARSFMTARSWCCAMSWGIPSLLNSIWPMAARLWRTVRHDVPTWGTPAVAKERVIANRNSGQRLASHWRL